MGWFLLVMVLFLNLSLNGFSEPLKMKNKVLPLSPPAVIVGTVFCDTCFHQHLSNSAHFIPGATVAVECRDEETSKSSFQQQVKTNKHGKFRVVLPFSVAKHIKKIKRCSVKLIKSSEPFCSVAASATSSALKFKNSNHKNGVRIYSAGFFTFKPLQQPAFCNQKSHTLNSKQINPQFLFPPIVPPVIQPPSFLPPNPLQPPPLIPNPFQPPAPVIPNPFQPPAPVIPNPFQPPAPVIPNPFQPPAPVIPNPFQPPAPVIPNPFHPPPGPIFPLPPFPFFTPPPPPPSFLPPFLPPIPGIPSGPPREESSSPIKQRP